MTALTSRPGIETTPSFSPDGKQVAFCWNGETGDNEDIYVVFVGSDAPLRITRDVARDVSPAWKPDGSQIAFARVEGGRVTVFVVSAHGASEQKLGGFPAVSPGDGPIIGGSDPTLSWSPDGQWLAVSRVTSGIEHDVFLLAEDGSSRRLLLPAKTDTQLSAAAFSPKADALAKCDSSILPAGRAAHSTPCGWPPRRPD